MHDFLQDVRQSLRMFAKSPGFTLAAVAALALGIAANTAIFSIVDAVLLKPVPFPDPSRVVVFQTVSPQGPFGAASPAKFQHWRAQADVVQDVSAYRSNVVNVTGQGFEEQLRASQVSRDYFRLFGAPVQIGRTFSPDEDRPGGPRVTVLSHGLWTRRFAADPKVVGRTISLSGEPYAVIGVIGRDFDVSEFGPVPDAWIPFQIDPNTSDQGHYFQAAGRLKPGVTLEQAQARLKLSSAAYVRKYPNTLRQSTFSVERLQEVLVREVRPTLFILLGAVAFVLLIACANVANLLLVRATARRREIAIRTAIGAGRARIVRQLLTESVLLSIGGGLVGLVLGVLGIRGLLAINTANLPRVGVDGSVVGLDWRVLLFTIVVSLGTGVLFGLVPALQASRVDLGATIKESGSRSGTSVRHNRTRSVLVVVEMALALVLLVGSVLLVRTAVAMRTVDPGFDAAGVLTMRMSMSEPRFRQAEAVELAVRQGVERLRALPGVVQASATCCVPLEGGYGLPFVIEGRPLEDGRPFHGGGGWLTVSPGYFEVFRIPVKRGRTFREDDTAHSTPVVIINETMARQYWPKEDPLAARIIIGRGGMREFESERERQIVGVVADVRDGGLNDDPQPTMYIPQAQVPDAANALNVGITPMAWVVRAEGNPFSLAGPIREALRQATGLPISEIRTMDQVIDRSMSRQRFNMWLMSVFGASALLLAAIGIYGLIAYSVEQRNQEIGIRLALGASPGQVRQMVVSQGMRLVLAGVVVGVASAAALAKVVASLLYGVTPWDPGALVGAPLLLAAVAFAATWLPARRASRVEPIQALRVD